MRVDFLQTWAPAKYGQRDRGEQANPFAANVSACWHLGCSSASGPVTFFLGGYIWLIARPAPARSLIESALWPTIEGGATALVLASHFRGSRRRSRVGRRRSTLSKANFNPGVGTRCFGSCNQIRWFSFCVDVFDRPRGKDSSLLTDTALSS